MKAYTENSRNGQFAHDSYATRRELEGHLAVLSGLIGNPHWQPTGSYDRVRQEAALRRSSALRSRAFTRTLSRGLREILRLARSVATRLNGYRLFHQNLAELNALDERTLRDIGVFRGDIAAIASRKISVNQFNAQRETLSRPKLKLVAGEPAVTAGEASLPRVINNVPKEAA